MRSLYLCVSLLCMQLAFCCSARADLPPDVADLVAGNSRFALNIYQHLAAAAPDKNVLVSPFSISAALSMTYAGAHGNTAQQMASVLNYTLPDDRLHSAFGTLLSDLTTPHDGYQLNVANRLFGQTGYPFHDQFLQTTANNYRAPLEPTNFVENPEGSRVRINDWVADQTNDKIKDLLPSGSVTGDTRLVLTNAVYFKADWKHQFDRDATYDEQFYNSRNGTSQQVSMMHQQHSFSYAEGAGYQMLEMPYAGDDLSMVVMLPTDRDGLTSLEASLTPQLLDEGLASLQSTDVRVALPKFTFDGKFRLGTTLSDLGMPDAFTGAADFSGIADDSLQISDVFHQTFVAVDEKGTEAAAATAVVVTVTSAVLDPPTPKFFNADHPFLFALRDTHSGSLLFLGRVTDPGSLNAVAAEHVPEPATACFAVVSVFFLAMLRCLKANRRG